MTIDAKHFENPSVAYITETWTCKWIFSNSYQDKKTHNTYIILKKIEI